MAGNNRPRRAALGAASLAVALTATMLAPSAGAAVRAPDKPILTYWANPGVAKDGNHYVMLHTGAWNAKGLAATSAHANGPWKKYTKTALLTKAPAWARNPNAKQQKRSVWAPSLVKGRNGVWVVFYSALVMGQGSARCIGTGTSKSATGPFKPDPRPIACAQAGTHPKDLVHNERSTSLIDATPSLVNRKLVLTYKTEHWRSKAPHWHTTIRVLNLDRQTPNKVIGNPVHPRNGASIQLTTSTDKYIEENPSLVFRGGRYTLFTSFGWYGTRDQYWTRWRQNTALWTSWTGKAPHRLIFPKSSYTYGRGNAQVLYGVDGKWNIFWNGQRTNSVRHEGPKFLYAGIVGWSHGTPAVTSVYKAR